MLMDKTTMWPVLRRMIGKDWIVGPGIALLREEPELAAADPEARPRHPRLDGQHRGGPAALPRPRGQGRDQRPAGADAAPARRRPRGRGPRSVGSPPWRRSPAGSVTPVRRTGAPAEGAVGPRQPCPCGSGKRYKACHGAGDGARRGVRRPAVRGAAVGVRRHRAARAGAGRDRAADGEGHRQKNVLLASLLPMAAPAMVRDSGDVWLGLQVQHNFGDPSRDLGAVLSAALEAEPGIVGPDRPARRRARACRTWSRATASTSPSTRASTSGSPTSRTTGRSARRWRPPTARPRRPRG